MSNVPLSQQWIVGICSIVFDIDVGQRVEYLVPEGCLSPEEQHDVAFHSFPDSMSMELHARTSIKDSTFFFRVRRRGKVPAADKALGPAVSTAAGEKAAGADASGADTGTDDTNSAPASSSGAKSSGAADGESGAAANDDGSVTTNTQEQQQQQVAEQPTAEQQQVEAGLQQDEQQQEHSEADRKQERFLYGFVFCRQRQDASLRRGGEQISVVVLAEHPLSAVLLPLSAVAGHQYFGAPGKAALQQVYNEVCRWPPPVAGPQLQLPIGFTALTARLPAWNTLPHPSTISALEQYGSNTLPNSRTTSARMQPGSATSTRRTLTSGTDLDSTSAAGGLPLRTASGATAAGLSPASSTASGLLSPAPSTPVHGAAVAAGGLAAAAALAASPFSTSSGGTQQQPPPPQQQLVIAPPQQQLERRRSSGSGSPHRISSGHSAAAAGANGTGLGADTALAGLGAAGSLLQAPTLFLGGAGGGGGSGHSGPLPFGPPPPEGSLQQISGMLADGCSPATVPMYPVPAPVVGGPPALPQHNRSRSSVLVPSRAVSHAGPVAEDLLPASQSSGPTGRPPLGPQHEAPTTEDVSIGRGQAQAWRRIPSAPQMPSPEGGAVQGAFHEVDVYTPLSGHLPRLWQLWELTLLGRALLLVAPTPGETAAGVAALISLIAPLPYSPDFRPYYCIHDIAFSRMASGLLPGPEARDVPTLLGVTNLYFIRALPHWPNVLSIGRREQASQGQGALAAVAPPGALAASMARANAAVQALRQRTQGASVLMSGHTEALWSSYKPLCRPDQALLAKLMVPKPGDVKSKVARIAFVNSDSLRRHFAELTSSFLAPFARYFEPDANGVVPGWNSEEFLFSLRSGGLPLPQPLLDRVGSPAAAVELYARFTSSLNFAAWFAERRRHVAHLIAPWPRPSGSSDNGNGEVGGAGRAAERGGAGGGGAGGGRRGGEADEEGGIASWFKSAAQHLDEVKLIGLFFTVEQQLMDAKVEAAAPDAPDEAAATVARLQREMAMLFFGAMSEELQLTCVSSPARRELLRSLATTATQAAQVQHLMEMLQLGGK